MIAVVVLKVVVGVAAYLVAGVATAVVVERVDSHGRRATVSELGLMALMWPLVASLGLLVALGLFLGRIARRFV